MPKNESERLAASATTMTDLVRASLCSENEAVQRFVIHRYPATAALVAVELAERLPNRYVVAERLLTSSSGRARRITGVSLFEIAGDDLDAFLCLIARVTERRGWGRGLRSAVSRYLSHQPAPKLRDHLERRTGQRATLADLIRRSHPTALTEERARIYREAADR